MHVFLFDGVDSLLTISMGQRLIALQMVKKLSVVYGTRSFITVFRGTQHVSLS
jgi:hypothetical protein